MSLLLLFQPSVVVKPTGLAFSTQAEGERSFLHFPTTSDQTIDIATLLDVNIGSQVEMEYYFEEMRRRHLAMLLLQGEDVILLPRLVQGTRCPFWKTEEEQCERPLDPRAACYNTGWIGGYSVPLGIKMVIPPANRTAIAYEEGVRKEYKPRPWTIHEPRLRNRDIIVRKWRGTRFEILDVNRVFFRGLVMQQEFTLRSVNNSTESYIYSVPVKIQ